jgi:hypothetical protein
MGLVKTRRLAAMQKQQRAKAGMCMKVLPKVDVRSPSRKQANALTPTLRSTT